MKFTAQVASLVSPNRNGSSFSREALECIATQMAEKAISYNFGPRLNGHMISAEVQGDKVIAIGEVEMAGPWFNLPHYLVPSYEVIKGEGAVHSEIKLTSMGITQTPADPTLSPMQLEGVPGLIETPDDLRNLPIEDIPCSCRDPNHWFVKFERSGKVIRN